MCAGLHLGFTLIVSVRKLLNLTQGATCMAGALVACHADSSGLPFRFAVVLAIVACGVLGILIDPVAFRPLRARGDMGFVACPAIVSSPGVRRIRSSIAQQLTDARGLNFPFGTFPTAFSRVASLRVSLLPIVILVTVAVLVTRLILCLQETSFGRQVRAVATAGVATPGASCTAIMVTAMACSSSPSSPRTRSLTG